MSLKERKRKEGETALYRHFDNDGHLLYVGISLSHVARLVDHRNSAHWYKEIAQVTIQWFETRVDAENAEGKAIAIENPKHNIKRPEIKNWYQNYVKSELLDEVKKLPKDPRAINMIYQFGEKIVELYKRMSDIEECQEKVEDLWDDLYRNVKDKNRHNSWVMEIAHSEEVRDKVTELDELKNRMNNLEKSMTKIAEMNSKRLRHLENSASTLRRAT